MNAASALRPAVSVGSDSVDSSTIKRFEAGMLWSWLTVAESGAELPSFQGMLRRTLLRPVLEAREA